MLCKVSYQDSRLFQPQPKEIHEPTWGRACYNHRHSHECRAKWAWIEAGQTTLYLERYEVRPILFITLVLEVQSDLAGVNAVLKRFKRQFKWHLPDAGYLLVVDEADGLLHWHGFAVGATVEQVSSAWKSARDGMPGYMDADCIRTTINRAVDYAYGRNKRDVPVPLVARGHHPTHMHNFFKGTSKAMLKAEFLRKHYGRQSNSRRETLCSV